MLLWFSFSTLVYAHSKCLFTLYDLYFVLKRNRAWESNFSFCWDIENVCLNHWVSAQWPPARILTRRLRVRVLLVPNAPTVADLPPDSGLLGGGLRDGITSAVGRTKLISNLSRFVVIVWVFVVLVLTSSYAASLTSMLTVQQLRPTYTGISEIKRKGESVGYQEGSFVRDMLKDMGFNDTQLKSYSSFEEYHDALELGSQNGGVSAIMEELPYIRVFVAKYCNMYTMTGPIHKTAGFGFVSFIPFHSFIGFVRLSFS
ncbi:putative ionotropic glutamate receptor [Helianthus annuus]|nr:putative ionotropic glutamate receptor [Helianthus annuus]